LAAGAHTLLVMTHIARWRRPVVARHAVDAAIVVACLGLTVLAVKTPWVPLPRAVIAVAGTVGSIAQGWRHRCPQVAALVGAATFPLSGNPGPWLAGLYAGAVYAPRRRLWLPGAAAWVGYVIWSWLDAGRPDVQSLVAGAAGIGLVLAVGAYLATRGALLTALRSQAEHAATERDLRDEQARAAERARIAREMHDVLAHKVSLIALHAGALELRAGEDVRLREGTALIRTTAREALQELRDVLGMLHANDRVPGSRRESLVDLAALVRTATAAGQVIELHDNAGRLPPATARVVYRVIQEGLTNARKHAPGAGTLVAVDRGDDATVIVTVRNGLSAAKPEDLPGARSGLVGLAERIRLVGGSMRSGPATRDGVPGWELHAVVPLLGQSTVDAAAPVEAP
jgi:signal transduction histidine kinase